MSHVEDRPASDAHALAEAPAEREDVGAQALASVAEANLALAFLALDLASEPHANDDAQRRMMGGVRKAQVELAVALRGLLRRA
jgi:hypothetical protein